MIINSPLPVTAVTALVCGTLLITLTGLIIRKRRKDRIVLGDGDNWEMTKLIRGQANATEQIPIFLILLALCEIRVTSCTVLVIIAGIFVIGRLVHAAYFAIGIAGWRWRQYGMGLTLIAQIAILVTLAITLTGGGS